MTNRLALVTGASGYIGGRLVPQLLNTGFHVRCFARNPTKLRDQPWRDRVDIALGDAANADDVTAAAEGVELAYYLVHSISSGRQFQRQDRKTAQAFARGAKAAGVNRLVYLGGLYPEHDDLSPHLASRREVGEILLNSGVPTLALQAAVILGSGSASFEILRYLTERLPVMVTPRWIDTRMQPIAVRDVLRYLVGAADIPYDVSRAFDIGGPDVVTYRQLMQTYARIAQLRRRIIVPVPVLTPALSSLWIGLITPVPSSIARPLVDSLIHEVVCKEHDIATWVSDPPEGLIGVDKAITLALGRIREYDVATTWSSADAPGAPSQPLSTDPEWAGGSLYVDERECIVNASQEQLWQIIEGIGGRNGWYSWPLAWGIRGVLDRAAGGPGLRRGRRHPYDLAIGDALDWWRVEEIEDYRLLRLRAEMRLPGLAWLELIVGTDDEGRTRFRQRAIFHPRGLAGHVYWRCIAPFHGVVFGGMQRNIARAAEKLERADGKQHDGKVMRG
jgi:uncharacterized protein YbjT (DUF2867 family)